MQTTQFLRFILLPNTLVDSTEKNEKRSSLLKQTSLFFYFMQRSLKSRSKRGTSSQNSTTKEVGNIYQKNLDQLLNYRSEYTAWSPVPRY